MKILVVDDSRTVRKFLIRSLSSRNRDMEFEEACDGQDAIDRLEKTQYDLILMDCNMPNLSGLDAVRRIRSSGDQIPIILITGNREEEDILEAIKAGANNYVAKPFKLNVVERKIRDTLSSAQTEPGPSA